MRLRNEELTCGLREQEEIVVVEWLRAHRRAQAQMREFANLMAGRQGPEVQLEGMRIGVKVEKPENHDGSKQHDLDTWLFQVQEYLNLTVIAERDHVPYAALWWCKLCETNNRPATWNEFCHLLREQFWAENYSRDRTSW